MAPVILPVPHCMCSSQFTERDVIVMPCDFLEKKHRKVKGLPHRICFGPFDRRLS